MFLAPDEELFELSEEPKFRWRLSSLLTVARLIAASTSFSKIVIANFPFNEALE
jgi:hypothetical protein